MCLEKLKLGVIEAILAIFCKGLSSDIKMLKNEQLPITCHRKRICEHKLHKLNNCLILQEKNVCVCTYIYIDIIAE